MHSSSPSHSLCASVPLWLPAFRLRSSVAMLILQLLLNGIALGAAYALAALGFVLVLNATRAVNFAQGDMVMAGGFLAVALAQVLPLPGILLLPAVAALMAALGLLISLVAYLPLKDRPPTSIFISTIAVGVILQQGRSEEHTSELQSLMSISYAGFCLKKKNIGT